MAKVDDVNKTKQLQQLDQILIDLIAELAPKNTDNHVIFIPQDSLFFVPFVALQFFLIKTGNAR